MEYPKEIKSLEAEIRALWTAMNERDKRYKVQFVTLGQAAELNNKAVSIAMEAADKAVTKSEQAVEKRFESVNEFRAQMGDMQATLARTDMVNSRFATLEKKMDEVALYQVSQAGGLNTLNKTWGYIIGFLGVAAAGAAFFFK